MTTIQTLTCPQCQNQFEFIPTNNRRKYCSNKCKRSANQLPEDARSRQRYLASPRGQMTKKRKADKYSKSVKGQVAKASYSSKKKLETRENRKPCLICAKPIALKRKRFCSYSCQNFNQLLFKLPKVVMPQTCLGCKKNGHFRQWYCSERCRRMTVHYKLSKKNGRHKRRAKLNQAKVENVNPLIIARRDKYKCHICRKRVDMNLDVQHKYSQTMDHLIPLSLGGDHTYANIRLAHRSCNSSKGNRAVNEQLLLFG